ncbi:MAG: hypothetical protein IJF61_03380, partial [Clostridia bacterium]|nr:hypothetical protein [Clostridia bacterium]
MLKQLLPLIVVGVAIWLCCTQYALWGGLLLVAMGVFMYFKRYTGFCISMAMRYYGISDIKTAFRWFEKAEKRGMNPKQKITYAYYLMREGRVEKSENILNAVLAFKLAPELKYPAKSNHAILMMKTGRMAEAQEELEEIFPTYRNTNVYGTLGYLYIMGNDMEKAKAFNLEAYDFNSENAVILDNMVQLYTKLGDYDEAYR